MTVNYKILGKQIKEVRKQRYYTQEKLAEAAELSTAYISHIENATKKPSLETVVKIANICNTSVDYLLDGNITYSQSAHDYEIDMLLSDCTYFERAIIYKLIKTIVQFLRDNGLKIQL